MEPKQISPIREDDYEDIGGYPFKDPQRTVAGVRQNEIPSVKEFVLGGGMHCDPFPWDLLLTPHFLFGLFVSFASSVAKGDNGTELESSW